MPAPKGNAFWQLRSKHGRDKLFKSPALLWEAACQYFKWIDEHPWIKNDAIKGGEWAGTLVQVPTARPYTITGFLLYANAGKEFWNQFKAANHKGFSGVIEEIEHVMFTQKFEGAAVGAFNANIIARDLGLVDKKDLTTDGESMNKGYYDFLMQRKTKK